jgi:hypothetical protein
MAAGYLATWSVFILGDDIIDPIEAARRAKEMVDDPRRGTWGLEDIETGEITTVDLWKSVVLDFSEEM